MGQASPDPGRGASYRGMGREEGREMNGTSGGARRGGARPWKEAMWSQPLLPSAVRLLPRGSWVPLGGETVLKCTFTLCNPHRVISCPRSCANPVSQRRTHNLREVHVGACLAQLGLVGGGPWLWAFLLPCCY